MESALGYAKTSVHTPRWTLRIRNYLAEFSDFFSEFTRYIAPTYRHDRCDRSVQMRLYTMNKRHFALVFLMFFACLSVTIIIGLLGPSIMETIPVNVTSLNVQPSDLSTGPFILKSPAVSTFNQQLWLTCKITTDKDDSGRFDWPFKMFVQIVGFVEDKKRDTFYDGHAAQNHSRTLQCATECKDIVVLHIGYLSSPYYVITINIYGLETMNYNVKDVDFVFTTYNSSFTQLEIWFRFTFLVVTFIATCLFAHSLRKFSIHNWAIEQKWMTILLPLLLLYNNPIFPLVFLVNSWIPGMFDIIFQTTFISSLMLFWLCLYHGIRQNKRKFATFYLPKIFMVGVVWLSVVALFSWQSVKELSDPTYNYQNDFSNFFGVKIFIMVLVGFYLLYLIYLIVRAYSELRSMPYFDLRLKFTTVLLVIVVVVTMTLTILRFGVDAFDGGFTSGVSTHLHNSTEFVAFYGLINIHLFTMAFVYSPSKNAVYESHFKDNPALSMLNDSEDEVVYGEETSLTSARPARAKYDSDEDAFN